MRGLKIGFEEAMSLIKLLEDRNILEKNEGHGLR